VVVLWCGGSASPSLVRLVVHLLLSSLFHIILTTTTTSLPVILTVAAARYRYFLQHTVITARTVYKFYLEVALFHSELSVFFSIKCFPDLERNISRS
jgi:hypothetical protein